MGATKQTDRTGWRSLFPDGSRATAVIIAVGIALHSANIYVATAVMPSVAADVGGLSLYAWAMTVFVFAAVLGSTATAALLGRSGTRAAYRVALLTVGAGTAVCALAPTMPILLIGRLLQGLGGGLLFALACSLVRLVLERRLRPYAMGLISAMWGWGRSAGRRSAARSPSSTSGGWRSWWSSPRRCSSPHGGVRSRRVAPVAERQPRRLRVAASDCWAAPR